MCARRLNTATALLVPVKHLATTGTVYIVTRACHWPADSLGRGGPGRADLKIMIGLAESLGNMMDRAGSGREKLKCDGLGRGRGPVFKNLMGRTGPRPVRCVHLHWLLPPAHDAAHVYA